ncbi:MAG: hypothetical protein N3E50_04495, partial [Candidatus Goldbacteria bacterium]|nr:hypothetical protein [Candidatus Goldiibacteriota bacterium]
MKKLITIFLLFIISCATFTSVSEEFLPLHLRLLSSNETIKSIAKEEFNKLDDKSKQDVLLKMVELLSSEEDPQKRIKILNTLQELKSDTKIIIPLIYSVSKNQSIREFKEIIYFLMQV